MTRNALVADARRFVFSETFDKQGPSGSVAPVRRRLDDGNDLEGDEIAPTVHPRMERFGVRSLHELETSFANRIDPARAVRHAVRQHPPALDEAPMHPTRVAERLDDHEQHFGS